jgi:hypothetical protein
VQPPGQNSIPQVREIVVGYQKGEEFKYGIGTNLDDALNQLFTGIAQVPSAPVPAPQNNVQNPETEKVIKDITAKYDEMKKQLDEMRQIVEAFDLKIAGEETVAGAPAWVVEAYPRKGYRPRGGITRFFPNVKGRVWIAKNDYQWVRAEAETIETISIGLFIARIHKGTKASFQQTRVNGEVWLPRQIAVRFAGRIALVKMMRGEVDISFRDYRKFQAKSRITGLSELQKEP